jgi:hypothetical protein
MKSLTAIAIGVAVALGVAMLAPTQEAARAAPDAVPATTVHQDQILVHTREEFAFTVEAPVDRALPLFGAIRERDWAPDWSPDVLWPAPASDREGMVFSIPHGDRTAIWVNTALDPLARRAQYVYVIPGVVATVITIGLAPHGNASHVSVRYERTALAVQANGAVESMARRDRAAGPEWEHQIKQHLSARRD